MLKIENLRVNYGGIEAVKGISFEVPDKQIITLIGASSARKVHHTPGHCRFGEARARNHHLERRKHYRHGA